MDVNPTPSARPAVGAEQLRYARVLEIGVRIGFVLLVVAFLAYVAGILPAHVALDRLPDLWTLPAHEYAVQAAVPRGWGWVRLLHRGELLAQGAIAVLAGVSIACFAALVPLYRARGDRLYLALAILEIVVLGLAASGLLTMGH
jgi:hypothetical protein